MNVPVVVPKYVLILLLCVNHFVWFGLSGSIPWVHPVQFYGFDPFSNVVAAMEIEHSVHRSCQILPSFQLILLPFLIPAHPTVPNCQAAKKISFREAGQQKYLDQILLGICLGEYQLVVFHVFSLVTKGESFVETLVLQIPKKISL